MAARKRPKVFSKDVSQHPALLRRWKGWLPELCRDMTDLLGKREIFWELQAVARENPKILQQGSFFDWMCRNYIVAVTVGIRSFVDQSTNSRSLWRMLFEVLQHPGVINRKTHVRMYRATPIGDDLGHITFNGVVGKHRDRLPQDEVRRDLRRLEDVSSMVRRFVNKRIAHRAKPGALRRIPKFNDVDAALDVLDQILCKYNLLLRAEGTSSMHATRQYDWREVLWEPWILKGSTLRPEV